MGGKPPLDTFRQLHTGPPGRNIDPDIRQTSRFWHFYTTAHFTLDCPQQVHYYRNTHMQHNSLQFEIQPSSGVPIYRQIMEQVAALITSEKLKPGDLLPSVRQMAGDLEINMMTVSKAYTRLEADGLIERVRGTGMRVRACTTDGSPAARVEELRPMLESVVTRGLQLGLTDAQILSALKAALKERRS